MATPKEFPRVVMKPEISTELNLTELVKTVSLQDIDEFVLKQFTYELDNFETRQRMLCKREYIKQHLISQGCKLIDINSYKQKINKLETSLNAEIVKNVLKDDEIKRLNRELCSKDVKRQERKIHKLEKKIEKLEKALVKLAER